MAKARVPLWAKIAAGVVVLVIVVIGVAMAFAPAVIKTLVERDGSAKLHRRVVVKGPVTVDWFQGPKIVLDGLSVANPSWARGPMVSLKQVRVRLSLMPLLQGHLVIPSLVLRRPRIHLLKPNLSRSNWVFTKHKTAKTKTTLVPQIGRLVITHGLLTVRDIPAHTNLMMTVRSATPSTRLILNGHGQYKGSPFTLTGALGSPTQATQAHTPYPVLITVHIGRFLAQVNGALTAPLALQNVNLHIFLKGAGLGRVNKAVNLPLPQTGPFQISGQLTRRGTTWNLAHFRGLVGKSDLEGTISVRPGHPIYLRANLVSHHLNFKDLAGFVKAKPKKVNGHVKVVANAQGPKKVLPAKPYKQSHLTKLNADVVFHADHVYASHMRIQDLATHLVLKNGILNLSPLNFGVADGLVSAHLTMNASQPLYRTQLRAIARGIHLRLLFPKIKFKTAGTGKLGGRILLSAPGDSVAAMAAHASGHLGLALARGSVNNLYVALAQLHIGDAALDWLSGMKQEPIPCAVIRLGMHNGLVKTRTFLIDTPSANILGRGTVNMRSQMIHLTIVTKPKHISIVSARGPLHISGTLKKPTFGVSRTALIERAGAAAILGAVLTPAAALIPLIDTAPGHKVDCPALLNKAGPKARSEALESAQKRTNAHH